MNAAEGTVVVATKPGRVAVAANNWGNMGHVVIIDHEDGDYSVYGHLADIKTTKGTCLQAGTAIGSVGYSGNAQCLKDNGLGPHLHFAVVRAAATGLADAGKPISTAVENAGDWLELAPEYFGNDNLDLGIKNPKVLLQNVSGCLR